MSDSGSNLKELEIKINNLERNNLNLKMQLYYLNNKYKNAASQSEYDNDNISVTESYSNNTENNNIFQNNKNIKVELISLHEENEYLKHTIINLESEILRLQLLRDQENIEYHKALHKTPNDNLIILGESRKHEIEIIKTIADHDANIIKNLQDELTKLQIIHENDQKLLDDCTDTLAQQIAQIQTKDSELLNLRNSMIELKQKLDLYIDIARQQEDVISNKVHNPSVVGSNEIMMFDEISILREENILLKKQLDRQNISINNQLQLINNLQTTTNAIKSVDDHETIKINNELDKNMIENNILNKKLNLLEKNCEIIRNEYSDLKRKYEKCLIQHNKEIEDNKERENELLIALEGVIKRCNELEIVISSQKQRTISQTYK